jgi:hypothetical protein
MNLNYNIIPLKSELDSLKRDMKRSEFLVQEHCQKVKNEIDIQAETLIDKINKYRDELFIQVDDYENEALNHCSESKEFIKMRDFIQEYEDFSIETDLSRINELTDEFTRQLDSYKTKLPVMRFNNKQVDFESIENDMEKIFGVLYEKPVENQELQPFKLSSELSMVKIDKVSLIPESLVKSQDFDSVRFKQLGDDSFLFIENYINDDKRFIIFSNDLKIIKKSKYFNQFFPPHNLLEKEYDLVVNKDHSKFMIAFNAEYVGIFVYVFDYELNLSCDASLESWCITANRHNILCLNSMNEIEVYGWNLAHLKCLTPTDTSMDQDYSAKSAVGFVCDDLNRVFISYQNHSIKISKLEENTYSRLSIFKLEDYFDVYSDLILISNQDEQIEIIRSKQKQIYKLNWLHQRLESIKSLAFKASIKSVQIINEEKKLILIEDSQESFYFYKI